MRVLARRERPHPGAQLRITDRDGWRITVFVTNIPAGRLADHERRHRLRARAEDRIRCLKDTGLRNRPLHHFTANQMWLELTALANDLLAWTQHLALTDTPARVWEPKRLRLRQLHVAGRSSTPADDTCYDYPAAGPGPTSCSPASTASPHSPPDSHNPPPPTRGPETRDRRGDQKTPATTPPSPHPNERAHARITQRAQCGPCGSGRRQRAGTLSVDMRGSTGRRLARMQRSVEVAPSPVSGGAPVTPQAGPKSQLGRDCALTPGMR